MPDPPVTLADLAGHAGPIRPPLDWHGPPLVSRPKPITPSHEAAALIAERWHLVQAVLPLEAALYRAAGRTLRRGRWGQSSP